MQSGKSRHNRLLKYLHDGQILTSSELIGKLVAEAGSEANARQIISRNSNRDGIWRSDRLRLARDERFFALQDIVGSSHFFSAVSEKLNQTSRQGLARCVRTLATEKILLSITAAKLLAVGSILDREKSGPRELANEHDALEEMGAKIIQKGMPYEAIVAPYGLRADQWDALALNAHQELRYEALLGRILTDRLRKQNILSWNGTEVADSQVPYRQFNGQIFTAYGFSFLAPLQKWTKSQPKPKACPVLVDCYHKNCTITQVESFLQRIDRATFRGGNRMPALGVIAAPDFSNDAWVHARKKGLVSINLRQMFGEEALNAMVEVEKLIHKVSAGTAADGESDFESMTETLQELQLNPLVADLRSLGLEILCALILRSKGYESLELGKIVEWKNTTRDVDVYGILNDHLWIIECKAYHKGKSVEPGEVNKFFTETVPALKNWLRTTSRDFSNCTAEIWTTGKRGKLAGEALFKLKRPSNDEWEIRRMNDMKSVIPRSIRKRGLTLIESISAAPSVIETASDSSSLDDEE